MEYELCEKTINYIKQVKIRSKYLQLGNRCWRHILKLSLTFYLELRKIRKINAANLYGLWASTSMRIIACIPTPFVYDECALR